MSTRKEIQDESPWLQSLMNRDVIQCTSDLGFPWSGLESQLRAPWLMLLALIYEGRSFVQTLQLVHQCSLKWGQRIWEAPLLTENELLAVAQEHMGQNWSGLDTWPGAVWSVGQWHRKWGAQQEPWYGMTVQQCVREWGRSLFRIGVKSPTRQRLRLLQYWFGMPEPAGLGWGMQNALFDDQILPWIEGAERVDRLLRRTEGGLFVKDQLPLERMTAWTVRCRRKWRKDSWIWLPHVLLLAQVKKWDKIPP